MQLTLRRTYKKDTYTIGNREMPAIVSMETKKCKEGSSNVFILQQLLSDRWFPPKTILRLKATRRGE